MYSALKMYDIVKQSSVSVTTLCSGVAQSASAVLFASGDKRVMYPHAVIMIHSVRTVASGTMTTHEMQADTRETERLTNVMCDILAESSLQTREYFREKMSSNIDVYYSAEEAVTIGLATDVGSVRASVKVHVETDLEVTPAPRQTKRRRLS